jgi:serine/threonine kinase PknH
MKVQDRTPEFLGPYRLQRRLGEGGMGVVYLALSADGLQVAVKALHPGMAQEDNARRRLAREVETMRRVRSRYVAEVLDADLSGESPYIVTRYVPGLTLDEVVTSDGALTGPSLSRLACGLAEALTAIHAAGVVHRDLKPGNVMLADGEPVVIDFGIAQLPDTTRLTLTGMFMGTPGYLAPEVIEGQDSGPASDVHSLGATLAFAATGRPPYGSGTYELIFYRIMHGNPDLDTLPGPLLPVVLAALSRDPARRPSAAELVTQTASLDPACLLPSPPGSLAGPPTVTAGGPAVPVALGLVGRTVTDGPGQIALPSSTRPLPSDRPEDLRDLLPPVSYAPARRAPASGLPPGNGAFAAAGYQGPASMLAAGASGGALANGSAAAGSGSAAAAAWPVRSGHGSQLALPGSASQANGLASSPGHGPAAAAPPVTGAGPSQLSTVTSWSPLVIATVVAAVAASIAAPIIGTAIVLVILVALRAMTTTGRQLARRRSGDGPRASDPVLAVALYPLAVFRSLGGLVLLAPVALLGFCVAVAITIIVVPVHPLPLALSYGAGALVALIGLGPGSAGSRTALARGYSAIARTPPRLAIAYVGVLAAAAWAALSAWSAAPAYWPLAHLHAELLHLPTLRMMLSDARNSLLGFVHRIGL